MGRLVCIGLTKSPPILEITLGVSSVTTATAEGTPTRLPAIDPPIRVVAVLANASLLETDASETENADEVNGSSAAAAKAERRTMIQERG